MRQRNFRLLWIGETISGAGSSMAVVGVPLLAVTVLRASTFAVAALTTAAYLPWLVIGLPAGAWVDRRPVRPLMIACDVISALLYASLPAAAWMGLLHTAQLVAVALLAGAANVVFATAYQVYLPSLVSAAELVEGNARLQAGASVAAIGGRAAAGLAAQALGAATALLFNAASFGVSAVCLLRIRPAVPPPARAGGTGVWPGIRFAARDPYLRPLTVYGAVANLAYTGNLALVVIFLIRVVGLSSAPAGLLIAAGAPAAYPAPCSLPGWPVRSAPPARWSSPAWATGWPACSSRLPAGGPGMACYVIGAGLIASGLAVGNVIVGSFRQQYCPPSLLGRVTASMRFLGYGMIPLGALLAGTLGAALGVRDALWAVQGIFAASAVLLLTPRIRAARDLPGYAKSASKVASSAGTSPTYSGGASV